MNLLKYSLQLSLIFIYLYLGNFISNLLSNFIVIPGSIIGMLMLFISLLIGIVKLKQLEETTQFFLKNTNKRTAIFTPYRLGFFIREGAKEGVISGYQDMMTRNIMRLGSIPIRKIMIPLNSATVVSSEVNAEQMKVLAKNVRFSRIPVFKGQKSNIIGVINLFDFLSVCTEDSKISDFLKETEHISADTLIDDALVRMQKMKQRMAIVIDKNNIPIGIVTIKDLVEEIVGELMEW